MKPTVLHVLEAFVSGTERHVLDLVRHVEAFDHVVAVPSEHRGATTDRSAERVRAAGGRVERLEMTRSPRAQHHNVGALLHLRRLIHRYQPAVVHGHSSIGGAFARVAAIGTRVPVAYTANGISRSRVVLEVERLLGRRTDAWIAVSASEGDVVEAEGLCARDRLHVIVNGLDVEVPPPLVPTLRQRLQVQPGAPLVGTIARLEWQKAPELFVDACAEVAGRVPDAEFVLIGSGPLRDRVEGAVSAAALGRRFHLVEAFPGAAAALGELDVFVLASRYEGAPYTVLEAMRAGVAVVVTDVVGSRDAVEHGRSGVVVPPDDAAVLGIAAAELLTDADRRRRYGEAGAQRFVERFDVRMMAAQTENLYRWLADGGAAAVRTRRRRPSGVPPTSPSPPGAT